MTSPNAQNFAPKTTSQRERDQALRVKTPIELSRKSKQTSQNVQMSEQRLKILTETYQEQKGNYHTERHRMLTYSNHANKKFAPLEVA